MTAAIVELDPRSKSFDTAVDEIARLERRIFPKHESLYSSLRADIGRKNAGLLLCRTSEAGEDVLVGYVMYTWVSSLCASITKLAVKESYRRHGHGEELLRAAIAKCRTRKIQRVSLHVDPLRPAAVSLYKKLGFRIDGLVESYYSPGRDAYRMYLDFDD